MFFMFASFDILMFFFVWFFVPETKGLSLEKMDELFGMDKSLNKLDEEVADNQDRVESIHEERVAKS